MEPSAVAASYDRVARKEHDLQRSEGIEGRAMFRNFNNFAKKALIATALGELQRSALWKPAATDAPTGHPGARVLDLGSGRGGDVPKWLYNNRVGRVPTEAPVVASLVGFDISPAAVEEAAKRYHDMKAEAKVPVGDMTFHVANCFAEDFWPQVDAACTPAAFDIATMQFAMHYGCGSRASLSALVGGVAQRLTPGGVFIGTIVDAAELSARLLADRRRPEGTPRPVNVSNDLFSVACDWEKQPPEVRAAMEGVLAKENGVPAVLPIGVNYYFTLSGLVDSDEFTVPYETLCEVSAEHGLAVLEEGAFTLPAQHGQWMTSKPKLREFGAEADLSAEEHGLVSLYRSFCFVKKAL